MKFLVDHRCSAFLSFPGFARGAKIASRHCESLYQHPKCQKFSYREVILKTRSDPRKESSQMMNHIVKISYREVILGKREVNLGKREVILGKPEVVLGK